MRRIYVKGNQNDLCKNSRETPEKVINNDKENKTYLQKLPGCSTRGNSFNTSTSPVMTFHDAKYPMEYITSLIDCSSFIASLSSSAFKNPNVFSWYWNVFLFSLLIWTGILKYINALIRIITSLFSEQAFC